MLQRMSLMAAGSNQGDPYYASVSLLVRNGAVDESPSPKTLTAQLDISGLQTYFSLISGTSTVQGFAIYKNASNGLQVSYYQSSSSPVFNILSASNAITVNAWQHIAFTRSGNVFRLFLDGVEQGANVTSTASMYSSKTPRIAGWTNFTRDFNGFIDDLRVTKGVARYTAGFTPPAAELPASVGGDANYNSVSLLLRNGSVGSAPVDESPSPKTITTVGNADNSTAIYKYGTSSMQFDGSGDNFTAPSGSDFDFGTGDFTIELWAAYVAGILSTTIYKYGTSSLQFDGLAGYLSAPKNTAFEFGAGDFTIECWARINTTGTLQSFATYAAGTNATVIGWSIDYDPSAGVFRGFFCNFTANYIATNPASVSANTWYHLAFVRSSSSIVMYVDGVPGSSVAASPSPNAPASSILTIGSLHTSARFLDGFIDDLRITKGVARYTASFTPPSAELPNF